MKCPADVTIGCDNEVECKCGFCKEHCLCEYYKEHSEEEIRIDVDDYYCLEVD